MRDYALAAIAGVWLVDGLSLLLVPRFMVERLREVIRQQPTIWTWQWLSVLAGAVLLASIASPGLPDGETSAVFVLLSVSSGILIYALMTSDPDKNKLISLGVQARPELPSSAAATPSGRQRGMFSTRPPPVMCDMPLMRTSFIAARTGFT